MIDSGDTAWLLVSTALVMLMTPGLALFYGGMVQGKNVLSTFMHSFFALGIVSIQWAVIGYSLSFGDDVGGFIGGTNFALLHDVGVDGAGRTVPHLLFMMYQGMFAIITPALISGAFAERMKFSAYCLFTLAWTTLVYDPVAHWVWHPDGWLAKLGALDFAGGAVVHLSSGVSALIVAIILGKRAGYPHTRHQPHNLTMTILGAGLLWFGWFGFNAGSALKADGSAVTALVTTHLAAAAGALSWGFVEMLRIKKVTMLGVASGLVAGLVAITPAAGFVSPMSAIWIGLAAGVVCYGGVLIKSKAGYDDALDAFGVHGIGGALGAVLTGVFAVEVGGLDGHWDKVGIQLLSIGAVAAYAGVVTVVLLLIIKALIGLRVDAETENEGLDGALHGETGYALGGSGTSEHAPAHFEPEAKLPMGSPEAVGA
ncbi:MAG: ammonium transporter [Deltaproteobacteria bacterium]|nr:ammonium transporter [Deltaproteobacteria bacterium]